MDERTGNTARSLCHEDGNQIRRNLERNLLFDAELCDTVTAAHLRAVVDHLKVAVQICAQEGIALALVLREIEAALVAIPEGIPADWQSNLRLHLVDYVTAAFAKGCLQPQSPPL
ncbi:hypothetical protein QX204_13135 [Nocardia sp. PE-7]|uniref:hypothetical protein n=1 Tax=Nocardia sp. PE-7 TaxID=3058426 RepID=UPI00265A4195|nr:hypothetical protein [Nocardia sp. PE-7]WKG12349.1 hypothetical protein QX204_13135 [Nocardia sp. PE-7]